MTIWIYRFHLIIPAALKEAATQQSSQIDPNGSYDFCVPLSDDGGLTATHYGMNTLATQTGCDGIVALAPQMPGASYFCLSSPAGELLSTNTEATVGTPWTWADSLALLGLQSYVEPEV